MIEILNASLSSVNIIPTVLLAFILIYWLTVIIGVIDLDTFDFDLEVEADVDLEADIDVDVDVHGFAVVLSFFNIGQMPFMIFLSFLVMPMWAMSIWTNHLLGNTSFLLSIAFLIPIVIVSLFIAKVLTTPIAKFYIKLRKEDAAIDPIGKTCKILLSVKGDSMGQAEIKVNGTSILVNAMTSEGVEIKKGETALVIKHIAKENYYIIEPYNL